MKVATIQRKPATLMDTPGSLSVEGVTLCTLERRADDKDHPRLPAGEYDLVLGEHHPGTLEGYACYHITGGPINLPASRQFELHVGNRVEDSLGCVLLGTDRVVTLQRTTLTNSWPAHTRFLKAMGFEPGRLVIRDAA